MYDNLETNPVTGRRQLCLVCDVEMELILQIPHEEMVKMADEAEQEYLIQFEKGLADSSQREYKMAERIIKRYI